LKRRKMPHGKGEIVAIGAMQGAAQQRNGGRGEPKPRRNGARGLGVGKEGRLRRRRLRKKRRRIYT
jgi:hypothetical protein